MSLFLQCDVCSKAFDKISEFNRHKEKKCCSLLKLTYEIKKDIVCPYCSDSFNREYSLQRHLENPKIVCFYKKQMGITQNVYNDNRTINNNNNKIVVNNYSIAKHGEETTSHFTEEVLLRILSIESFPDCCAEFMRVLYFNKEVPENQNWAIVYPRNKKAGVQLNIETNKFERVETNDIIDSKFSNMAFLLFPKALKLLERHFIKPFLTKTQVYNINKLGMHFGMMNISKTSKDVHSAIRKMAYEGRQEQMDTWKQGGHKGNHLSLKF